MNTGIRKRLFSHGGSKSVDLPAKFVHRLHGDHVVIEERGDTLVIRPEDEISALESDPRFAAFVKYLATDALAHPEKLVDLHDVWDAEWDDLLEGMKVANRSRGRNPSPSL